MNTKLAEVIELGDATSLIQGSNNPGQEATLPNTTPSESSEYLADFDEE
jgi:hypothetical protein